MYFNGDRAKVMACLGSILAQHPSNRSSAALGLITHFPLTQEGIKNRSQDLPVAKVLARLVVVCARLDQ